MASTGREPATIRIAAYRSLLCYAPRHGRRKKRESGGIGALDMFLLALIKAEDCKNENIDPLIESITICQ